MTEHRDNKQPPLAKHYFNLKLSKRAIYNLFNFTVSLTLLLILVLIILVFALASRVYNLVCSFSRWKLRIVLSCFRYLRQRLTVRNVVSVIFSPVIAYCSFEVFFESVATLLVRLNVFDSFKQIQDHLNSIQPQWTSVWAVWMILVTSILFVFFKKYRWIGNDQPSIKNYSIFVLLYIASLVVVLRVQSFNAVAWFILSGFLVWIVWDLLAAKLAMIYVFINRGKVEKTFPNPMPFDDFTILKSIFYPYLFVFGICSLIWNLTNPPTDLFSSLIFLGVAILPISVLIIPTKFILDETNITTLKNDVPSQIQIPWWMSVPIGGGSIVSIIVFIKHLYAEYGAFSFLVTIQLAVILLVPLLLPVILYRYFSLRKHTQEIQTAIFGSRTRSVLKSTFPLLGLCLLACFPVIVQGYHYLSPRQIQTTNYTNTQFGFTFNYWNEITFYPCGAFSTASPNLDKNPEFCTVSGPLQMGSRKTPIAIRIYLYRGFQGNVSNDFLNGEISKFDQLLSSNSDYRKDRSIIIQLNGTPGYEYVYTDKFKLRTYKLVVLYSPLTEYVMNFYSPMSSFDINDTRIFSPIVDSFKLIEPK